MNQHATAAVNQPEKIRAFANNSDDSHINKFNIQKFLLVTCYTPNGTAIQIRAKDPEHAKWLMKMNPKPNGGVCL